MAQDGHFKPDGKRWAGWLYVTVVGPDGKRSQKYQRFNFGSVNKRSYTAAWNDFVKLRDEINKARMQENLDLTGKDFNYAATSKLNVIGNVWTDTTHKQRNSYLNCHLRPAFGTKPLTALTYPVVQQFFSNLVRNKIADKTVENIKGAFFGILKHAEQCGWQTSGLKADQIKLPKKREPSVRPHILPYDAPLVIERVRNHQIKTMIPLATAGLRSGEILGLRVSDIDFVRSKINVTVQAVAINRKLRQPKSTCSQASVVMEPETFETIQAYLKTHWRENPLNLLFPNRNNKPWKASYVTKVIQNAVKSLGWPTKYVGLHAFRRGLGTSMALSKASMVLTQKRLRHGDIKTTAKYYVNVDDSDMLNALKEARQYKRAS